MPLPLVVRPADAAIMLGGVTRQHVYNLIERGELRRVHSGRVALVPVVDIYRHLGLSTSDDAPAEHGTAPFNDEVDA